MKQVLMLLSVFVLVAAVGCMQEQVKMGPQWLALQVMAQPEGSSPEAAPAPEPVPPPPPQPAPQASGHGVGHAVIMYVPNRVLDVFDIVRLRVRVGPGIAIGVRATQPISFFMGSYISVYAGLPGPRLAHTIKLPFGPETNSGIAVSVADVTTPDAVVGPGYSFTEIGASAQAILVGFDVGIDPIEALDLVTGFLFIDLRGDDL